jgi:hypothetical protein
LYTKRKGRLINMRMESIVAILLCMLVLSLIGIVNAYMWGASQFPAIDVIFENKDAIVKSVGSDVFNLNMDECILICLLTNDNQQNVNPSWSPDGKKIVFESCMYSDCNIYLMSIDKPSPYLEEAQYFDFQVGRDMEMNFTAVSVGLSDKNLYDKRRLTMEKSEVEYPTWGFDSKNILFGSNRSGNWDIWVMDNDGKNEKQITSSVEWEKCPSYSHDGRKIIYSKRGDYWHIWSMDADGSNEKQLTADSADDNFPKWSPDGSKIAFLSNRSDDTFNVWIMDADGKNKIKVLNTEDSSSVAWSPDGSKISFTTGFHDLTGGGLWLIDVNGKNKTKISIGVWGSHSWSPDGSKIVTCYGGPEYGYNIGVTEVPLTIDGSQLFKEPLISTPKERIPGFKAVLAMVGLLTLAYVIRRRR